MIGGGVFGQIFLMIAVVLVLSIVLNTLLGRSGKPAPRAVAPERGAPTRESAEREPLPWSAADLAEVLRDLAAALGLDVLRIEVDGDREAHVDARDPRPLVGGRYGFAAIRLDPDELVDANDLRAFHDNLKVEGYARGIFVTNGYFTQDAIDQIASRPIEILNRQALLAWMDRLELPWPQASPRPQASPHAQESSCAQKSTEVNRG